MAKKKIKVSELFKLLVILVVAGGLIIGLILAQQRQVVEKEASGGVVCEGLSKSDCQSLNNHCQWFSCANECYDIGTDVCDVCPKVDKCQPNGGDTYNKCNTMTGKCEKNTLCPEKGCGPDPDECQNDAECMTQVPTSEGGTGPDEDTTAGAGEPEAGIGGGGMGGGCMMGQGMGGMQPPSR